MPIARATRWAWSQAWLVLLYMAATYGANGVGARLAAGEMPPLVLVVVRWFIVCAVLAALFEPSQWLELRALGRAHWRRLAWMGLLGYAGFNALYYIAAYSTSAVNLTLLQSATPALVLAGAGLIHKVRIRALQIVGMGMTMLGVLIVATHGDLTRLRGLRLDRGDALVLIACFFYAAYTLGLRSRPPGTPLVFFAGMAAASLLWSLPMAGFEIAMHQVYWPSGRGWIIAVLVAFGPSFTGQLAYMRGVDLIGPARAGLYANLVPIFGSLCAVAILGEAFTLAHAAALVLGLAGITLAEWRLPARPRSRRRAVETVSDPGLP
jgi:drug/metabolite transporter (DMT)-like permease